MIDTRLLSEGVFQRTEGLLAAEAGEELLMMSVDLGRYFNLNAVGARIWALLEKPLMVEAMLATLLAEYDVTPEVARQELETFLGALHERGLVTVSNALAG